MTGLEILGLIGAILCLLPILAFFIAAGCWSGDAYRDHITLIRKQGYGEGKTDGGAYEDWKADMEKKGHWGGRSIGNDADTNTDSRN